LKLASLKILIRSAPTLAQINVILFLTLLTQRHEILSQNTRYIKLSCGKNSKSLSHLVLKRYEVVKDGQTDRITVANTRKNKAVNRFPHRQTLYIIFQSNSKIIPVFNIMFDFILGLCAGIVSVE